MASHPRRQYSFTQMVMMMIVKRTVDFIKVITFMIFPSYSS